MEKMKKERLLLRRKEKRDRRLRVGFLSMYFKDHSSTKVIEGIIERLNDKNIGKDLIDNVENKNKNERNSDKINNGYNNNNNEYYLNESW